MLSYKESLKILKETNALLEGHFILSSGLHSKQYIQCAKLLSHPKEAELVCSSLCEKIRAAFNNIDIILSPAIGGIVVGYEIGRQLKKQTIFAERVDGILNLRRDFSINALAVSLNSKTWGEVIDVSNSLEDLENGVIKILHPNSFIDDPTRIFRAIKYANRLNMKISKCTYENMYKSIENVNLLSGKRIANEILSIFQEDNFENILNHQIMIMIFEKFEFHLADRNTLQDLENIKNICINDENMWWVFISSHFNYLDREKFSNRLDLKTKNHKAIMDFTTVERMDTNLQKEDIYKYLNMIPKNILEISKKLLEEKSILQIEIFQSILFDLETIIDGESILELGVNEGPEIGRVLNSLTMKIVTNGAMSIQAQKEF